ncbi:hypothetical protein [Peijinzhouia sedimentorum]
MKELDDLKNKWQSGKKDLPSMPINSQELIKKAQKKKKASVLAHYGTITILSITLIVLILFFTKVAVFQETLSHIGVALMAGGLALRIIVEAYSLVKAKRISLEQTTIENTELNIHFYNFRKKIHSTFTIIIFALYIIGFYMLTPEFSQYIEFNWMLLMDGSFVIIMLGLIWIIRKSTREELQHLKDLIELKQNLKEA